MAFFVDKLELSPENFADNVGSVPAPSRVVEAQEFSGLLHTSEMLPQRLTFQFFHARCAVW